MRKPITVLITLAMFFTLASISHAGPRDCKTLLTGECVGCHEKEKFCENTGKTERFWKGMLGLMESNGADLTKDERAGLIACLSEPSATAQEVCK